jgi:hypothetical protein
MNALRTAARRSAARWQHFFGAWRPLAENVEAEAGHLHRLELDGESAATPFVAMLEVALFLLPVVVVVIAVSLVAARVLG